jgi:hypothetical protein
MTTMPRRQGQLSDFWLRIFFINIFEDLTQTFLRLVLFLKPLPHAYYGEIRSRNP